MRKLALTVVAIAAAGFLMMLSTPSASAQVRTSRGIEMGSKNTPVYVNGPLYMTSANGCDGGDGICFRKKATLAYDFPSIPATGAGSGCQDSAALTVSGCRFGDTLSIGIDQVPPSNLNAAMPAPYVSAADTVKIRVCNDSSDGGAIDWPDASYTVTCTR